VSQRAHRQTGRAELGHPGAGRHIAHPCGHHAAPTGLLFKPVQIEPVLGEPLDDRQPLSMQRMPRILDPRYRVSICRMRVVVGT
jgi:hypothetical protein